MANWVCDRKVWGKGVQSCVNWNKTTKVINGEVEKFDLVYVIVKRHDFLCSIGGESNMKVNTEQFCIKIL